MKELYRYQLNKSSQKQGQKSRKHKTSFKLFAKNCSPKAMITRNNTIYKKGGSKDFSRRKILLEESSNDVRQAREEKVDSDVEQLCCSETCKNFKEEQSVCLISSSSEIQESLEVYEALRKTDKKNLEKLGELVEESDFDNYSPEKSVISEVDTQKQPIFVDLTIDERNTRKRSILKRLCDIKTGMEDKKEKEDKNEKCFPNVVLEPRIIIADSSSKLNWNGNGSLATALRDRGPCLIPMQPNRSLPIRPAPSVPTRSFRKDCSQSFVLPKSTATNVAIIDLIKSADTQSNEEIGKVNDTKSKKQVNLEGFMSSIEYVVPQAVGVQSLKKRQDNNIAEHEKDNIKENKKKKRLQETDSNQNEEERMDGSIKEFLANFCGSNATGEIQNLCTEKCARTVFTTKEESNNTLVPPLRLKKVVSTDIEDYNHSKSTTDSEHESNYRIITGTTPQPSSSPNHIELNNLSDNTEESTNVIFSNNCTCKLKYRRNRLKQKLRDLRSKAVELRKQMASDSNSRQNTRLRQVRNRYEKQIENLSKLQGKLSAGISVSKEVIDMNDDNVNSSDNECAFNDSNDTGRHYSTSMNENSPVSSPEPPKLLPHSPLNYEDTMTQEICSSPPVLPRICLAVSSSQNSSEEEIQITERKVWPINEKSMEHSVNRTASDLETTAVTPLKQQNISVDAETSDLGLNKEILNHSKKFIHSPESNYIVQEKGNERNKLVADSSVIQEAEKIKCLEFSDPGPVISSVISAMELPAIDQDKKVFETTPCKEFSSKESNRMDILLSKDNESNRNTQRIISNTGQSTQFNASEAALSQEHFILRQNYNGKEASTNSTQNSGGSHSITEQFPTLGNWLARMSKKQTSRTKSKLQAAGNISLTPMDNFTRIRQTLGFEVPKMVGPNISNDIINATTQCDTERWQYQHQQQQRQQLLQHVAASATLSQPIATVPSLRSGVCAPVSMTQIYPNNYSVDSYNGAALRYHPTICPYRTYSYHPRLHPSSVPGYHFPVQESLRPIQHMEKRFPLVHDPMLRYPLSSTNTLQHPSNLELGRLRGNCATTNSGTATCLPSLYLSAPSLSSAHQSLPRAPLVNYPTNSQFSRNRIIPDVVAAAAAAAVVAAASFDTQRNTLTYNQTDTHTLSAAGFPNVIDGESHHISSSNKSTINRDLINQPQNNNFSEENHENAKFQQMQNFLFDRLALVKTADNFAQTNSVVNNNDSRATMTSIISATPYRVPLITPYAQLAKNVSGSEARSCETPHLGKANHSSNSLHNFTCSNCGDIQPKFKCLGCEMAFYCDERCQEKHWYVHVQKCPKKMPKLKKVT